MELNNEFRVGVPVSDAWKVLTDVERIAPMLPGAQLQEIDGDEYRGIVKVKVGPITAQYKGKANFVERDEKGGKVVLRCQGRDTRGQGNANATITALMKPDGAKTAKATKVTVTTDLTVTGKVAQFGRGVLADVSAKLISQFVDALEKDIQEHGTAGAEGDSNGAVAPADKPASSNANSSNPAPAKASAKASRAKTTAPAPQPEPAAASPSAPPADVAQAAAGPRTIHSPEPDPVDLFDAAGGSVAKRMLPLLGAAAAVVLVLVVRNRRRAARRRRRLALTSSLPRQLGERLPDLGELGDRLPDLGQLGDRLPDLSQLGDRIPDLGELGDRLPNLGELGERLPSLGDRLPRLG